MQMKVVQDGVKKFGSVSKLQKALIRQGVDISHTALNASFKGETRTLRFDILTALVYLVYSGDWTKAGKAIEADNGK